MPNGSENTVKLPEVPVAGDYDVVICGAGPAGIGAAIAAGRGGARTLLVERSFYVGGLGSQTGINTWCDTPGGPIFDELEERMDALGKARRRFDPNGHLWERGRVVLHGETLKLVAMRMIREAGAEVLFGHVAAQAIMDGETVTGLVLAGKGGLSAVRARTVIDCTADAEIAAQAGAEIMKGDPEDGRLMHVNFMFSLDGVDREMFSREKPPDEEIIALISRAHAGGTLRAPTGAFRPAPEHFPYHAAEEELILNYWEIEGVDCSDPMAVSDTVTECQGIALEVIEFCRRNLPGYENCGVGRVWDALGTRESRRIVGRYVVTREDLLAGRKFDDGITRACFFIDFHDSPPGDSIPYTLEFKQKNSPPAGDFYEIPYRSLLPEKVRGLLVAGRCISADRAVISSMRVMPSCMFTGEAAGTAAALAAGRDLLPDELDGAELKRLVLGG